MREIETDWWFLVLPDEWGSEQDDDTILVFDQDELGCISLSTLASESGTAADEGDLKALLNEIAYRESDGKVCQIAEDWRGWVFDTLEDGDFIREWFLLGGGHILLISYSCAEDDKDMDISVVEQILDSLRLKDEDQ